MSSNSKTVNKVLGSGKVHLDEGDGLRYTGDSPSFDISIATTEVTDMSSDVPVAQTDMSVTTQVKRTGTLVLKNVNGENLSLFLIGTLQDVAQTSGSVMAEAHNAVNPDRYYQLGAGDSNPTGVRGISAVVVKNDASPPVTYVLNTDYTVDLVTGLLYIVASGAIVVGTNLRVNYTKAANTREQVVANSNEPVECGLKFISDNIAGDDRDAFGPRVKITPNGKFVWKDRQTVQSATFDLEFLNPIDGSGMAPLYIDGRPE